MGREEGTLSQKKCKQYKSTTIRAPPAGLERRLTTVKRAGIKFNTRGHPGLNWGPLDLQSNAVPLSVNTNERKNAFFIR